MTSHQMLLVLLCFPAVCASQIEEFVEEQQDVTLNCLCPTESISVLKWTRPELNTNGYVYFYRDGRCYDNYQHPSLHGRVELRQADMKGGDASLILRNVTFSDAGTYECYVSSKRSRTPREVSQFIVLTVTAKADLDKTDETTEGSDPHDEDSTEDRPTENWLLVVGLVIAAAAATSIFIAICLFIKCKPKQTEFSPKKKIQLLI